MGPAAQGHACRQGPSSNVSPGAKHRRQRGLGSDGRQGPYASPDSWHHARRSGVSAYTSVMSSPCHLVPDVNRIPFTHTAKQLPCPQSVLCSGCARGAGFPSTPIQSCLVSLSPSCQLLHISGESASAPRCPAPAPGSLPSCSGPRLPLYSCHRETGTGLTARPRGRWSMLFHQPPTRPRSLHSRVYLLHTYYVPGTVADRYTLPSPSSNLSKRAS